MFIASKESCLPPFPERELPSAHRLGHDLSLQHVTSAVAAEVAETQTRAVLWVAAPWEALGSCWENSCLQQAEQS